MDMKDLFIQAHEELIAEAMEADPTLSEADAYDLTADKAYDLMRDKYADMVDRAKDRAKAEGNWPPRG